MKRVDPPAYVAILQTARALGWPTRFVRDLTHHDRLWVSRLASGKPFLWAVHEAGTTHVPRTCATVPGTPRRTWRGSSSRLSPMRGSSGGTASGWSRSRRRTPRGSGSKQRGGHMNRAPSLSSLIRSFTVVRDAQTREIQRLRSLLRRVEELADSGVGLSVASGRRVDAKYLRAIRSFVRRENRRTPK